MLRAAAGLGSMPECVHSPAAAARCLHLQRVASNLTMCTSRLHNSSHPNACLPPGLQVDHASAIVSAKPAGLGA